MWSGTNTQPSYGVRFYDLYESFPAGFGAEDDFDKSDGKRRRWSITLLWRISFWMGFVLLMFGSFTLLFGYFWPKRDYILGREMDMIIIDNGAVQFNQLLTDCKMVGLGLFVLGGTIFGMTLLLPSLVGANCLDVEDDEEEEIPSNLTNQQKESKPNKSSMKKSEDKNNSGSTQIQERKGSNSGIPVTERVKAIQPKNESHVQGGGNMNEPSTSKSRVGDDEVHPPQEQLSTSLVNSKNPVIRSI